MAKKSSRDRVSNEVNAGSMADIAFLLLIFFLVTTTIVEDKGILVKLPPWSEEEVDPTKLNTRNVFSVLVNAQNELLVRGEPTNINDLRDRAKEFIVNPKQLANLAEKPTKAIISLKNDRGTNYKTYLKVYNELLGAYNELWDEEVARNYGKYGKDYNDQLPYEVRKAIKGKIPMVLSEAEPTTYGDE
ncbi:MAG: biopolymer transport protein ExbD [Polaribacter sp.]|jgi:biopolymer transport protein ExbD